MTGHVLFSVVSIVAILRVGSGLRSGRLERSIISAVGLFVYAFCMWLPAYLQGLGALDSKLQQAGFLGPPTAREFEDLAFRWSGELALLILAEAIAVYWMYARSQRSDVSPIVSSQVSPRFAHWADAQTIALVLLFVGVVATFAFPSPGLENRGSGGQGIQTMLKTCLVSGLALLVYFRCFSSRFYVFLLLFGTLFLVASNVRSPLVVLFLAYIASEISRRRDGFSARRSVVLAGLVAVVAILGSFMSTMRANVTRNLGLSYGDVLSQTIANPLIGIYSAGIDTLDGYRFSEAIVRYEPSRPSDLLLIVTTFVPRAIWPDKPNSIGVDLSSKYLGYNSSGQFLSPMGYLNLVWGSYGIALLSFFMFALIFATLVVRLHDSFWLCLLLVVVFRFMLGGSSFDIYYGLVLAIPVYLVKSAVSVLRSNSDRIDEQSKFHRDRVF